MTEKTSFVKERRILSKLFSVQLAKDWTRSHVSSEGAVKAARDYVANLTDVNVLKELNKINQKQLIKTKRKAVCQRAAQLKEARKLKSKSVRSHVQKRMKK